MEIQPKSVVLLGSSGGVIVPAAVDAFGILQVSVPHKIVGGVELQADLINTATSPITPPEALATAAILYGTALASTTTEKIRTGPSNTDGINPQGVGNLMTMAQLMGWDGATWDRMRIANVFKTAFVTAVGPTPIWTPTAGTSFRLMGYTIDVGGTQAATGPNRIQLQDGGVTFRNHIAQVIQTQSANVSGGDSHMGADLGQGYLSSAPNNVLNLLLTTALATGGVAINLWGTEE